MTLITDTFGQTYSVAERPSPVAKVDPKAALLAVQREYGAMVRETPGVTEADVDDDILSIELLALRIVKLAKDACRFRGSSSDRASFTPMLAAHVAEHLASDLADSLGHSNEWAKLLTETVKIEAGQ